MSGIRPLKISETFTISEGESFKKYLYEVSKIELFSTPEEEVKCVEEAQKGNQKAKDELVSKNLRFVISVAKQYTKGSNKIEDLVNEGNIGLIDAIHSFDPTVGIKFISYAVWHIRKRIMTFLSNNSRLVRLPNNKIISMSNMSKHKEQLEQKLGRQVDVNDMINDIGNAKLSPKHLLDMDIIKNYSSASIDKQLGSDGFTMKELLTTARDCEKEVIEDEKNETLDKILSMLQPKTRKVIEMYFGIGYDYNMSLNDIGKILGVSKERIRQLKDSGLSNLKDKANRLGVEEFNI